MYSPSSNHTGGVNALRMDGSVSLVSDTVDCGRYAEAVPQKTNGASPFGVWGAMGSPAGGESRTID